VGIQQAPDDWSDRLLFYSPAITIPPHCITNQQRQKKPILFHITATFCFRRTSLSTSVARQLLTGQSFEMTVPAW
jgi:hypothetical protein